MRYLRWVVLSALLFAGPVQAADSAAAPPAELSGPVLQVVEVERVTLLNAPGWRAYYDRYKLTYTDLEGAPDLESEITEATATRPGGEVCTLEYDVQGRLSESVTTITYTTPQSFTPPKVGPVVLRLTTRRGPRLTVRTPVLHQALGFLEPVSPVPEATISDPQPHFRWKGAASKALTLQVAGERVDGKWVWDSKGVGDEAVFNHDGAAHPDRLEPACRYTWVARTKVNDEEAKTCAISYSQLTRARFQIDGPQPPQPKVAGTLLWGNYYTDGGADATARMAILHAPSESPLNAFVGPVGIGYPDLSPDGRQLLYASDDGIWLDRLDGTPPKRLAEGFCRDPHWSPDMKQVVYVKSSKGRDPGGDDLDLDLWVCNADGSNRHPLSNLVGYHERFPQWSPDGKWIAYRRVPHGDLGQCLWVARPDGREKHPIIATSLKGYPDFEVSFLSEHDWSPDGTRLVTLFMANSSTDYLSGLGIISAAGGELTPLFITPPNLEDEPSPHVPKWSPDGAHILFSAEVQICEPLGRYPRQIEMWIINADGSGSPVRFTYDHAKPNGFSWRAVKADPARLNRCGRTRGEGERTEAAK